MQIADRETYNSSRIDASQAPSYARTVPAARYIALPALLFVLLLTACGSKGEQLEGAFSKQESRDILTQAVANLGALSSFSYQQSIESDIDGARSSIDVTAAAEPPDNFYARTSDSAGVIEYVQRGQQSYIRRNAGLWTLATATDTASTPIFDPSQLYDTFDVLTYASNFQDLGEVVENGKPQQRFQVTIERRNLRQALTSLLGNLDPSIASLIAAGDLRELHIDFYIDKERYLPVRAEINVEADLQAPSARAIVNGSYLFYDFGAPLRFPADLPTPAPLRVP